MPVENDNHTILTEIVNLTPTHLMELSNTRHSLWLSDPTKTQPYQAWEQLCSLHYGLIILSNHHARHIFEGEYYFRQNKQDDALQRQNYKALTQACWEAVEQENIGEALRQAKQAADWHHSAGYILLAETWMAIAERDSRLFPHGFDSAFDVRKEVVTVMVVAIKLAHSFHPDGRASLKNAGIDLEEKMDKISQCGADFSPEIGRAHV